jgi:hypothetical protein
MSWLIERGPTEVGSGGYDATVWQWTLRDEASNEVTSCLVQVSGTAMATAEDLLPTLVADARRSCGQTALETVLDWIVPPSRIELGTSSQRPRMFGGVPPTPGGDEAVSETARIRDLAAWFAEQGIDLEIERQGDGWNALMIPQHVRLGSADYGRGPTRLEAAEDAKRRFLARMGVPPDQTSPEAAPAASRTN